MPSVEESGSANPLRTLPRPTATLRHNCCAATLLQLQPGKFQPARRRLPVGINATTVIYSSPRTPNPPARQKPTVDETSTKAAPLLLFIHEECSYARNGRGGRRTVVEAGGTVAQAPDKGRGGAASGETQWRLSSGDGGAAAHVHALPLLSDLCAASRRERARLRGEWSWLCARRQFNESLGKNGDLSGNVGVAGIAGLFPAPLAQWLSPFPLCPLFGIAWGFLIWTQILSLNVSFL